MTPTIAPQNPQYNPITVTLEAEVFRSVRTALIRLIPFGSGLNFLAAQGLSTLEEVFSRVFPSGKELEELEAIEERTPEEMSILHFCKAEAPREVTFTLEAQVLEALNYVIFQNRTITVTLDARAFRSLRTALIVQKRPYGSGLSYWAARGLSTLEEVFWSEFPLGAFLDDYVERIDKGYRERCVLRALEAGSPLEVTFALNAQAHQALKSFLERRWELQCIWNWDNGHQGLESDAYRAFQSLED
jgi:hypothetical protein